MSGGRAKPAFAWPPRRADEAPPAPEARPLPWESGPRGRLVNLALDLEATWLGVARAPMRRLRAEGWAPNGPLAYCPRCGGDVGPYEADLNGCSACRGGRRGWERLIRLGRYEGALREAVTAMKFQAWRRVGTDLGALLGASIAERLATLRVDARDAQIAPVPMTTARRITRGIDHTTTLARAPGEASGLPVVRLLRKSARPAQVSLTRTERTRAPGGAFVPLAWARPAPLVIVLDDVTTTGATLRAACSAVGRMQREAGLPVRVWGAVVAVTPRPDGR
jgi:predicted amidophosphoribosyltransferase